MESQQLKELEELQEKLTTSMEIFLSMLSTDGERKSNVIEALSRASQLRSYIQAITIDLAT
jgi:hypothetical protein